MENIREFMKMFHMLNIILNYKKRETYTQWIVLSTVYKSLNFLFFFTIDVEHIDNSINF